MIYIKNRHTPIEKIKKKFQGAQIIDVTSRAVGPYVKFSPFYPLGDIPVPFSNGILSMSVEGVWQGLKVFKDVDVDLSSFENSTMKRLKRTERRYGKTLGHRKGVNGDKLLGYIEARKEIYLPTYNWVLENKLQNELKELKSITQKSELILLDYETNEDIENPTKPLSHASLIKRYLLEKM